MQVKYREIRDNIIAMERKLETPENTNDEFENVIILHLSWCPLKLETCLYHNYY